MTNLVWLGLVIAALVALWVSARRAITIAELDLGSGSVRVIRGGVAPPILADLREIARRSTGARGRVLITQSRGRAEVRVSGAIPEPDAQRIRNVIGSVPLARLRNAHRR